jgi:ABC-type transport system substrate-binding protein
MQDIKLRKALVFSIDKKVILEEVLGSYGRIVNSPIVTTDNGKYKPKKARELVSDIGKKKRSLNLLVSEDRLQILTANKLKEFWEEVGFDIRIEKLPSQEIGSMVQDSKKYDILLFGYSLSATNNLFPYWHSSQIDGGFNLSSYSDEYVDDLFEENIIASSVDKIKNNNEKIVEAISNDYPAAFIFSASYLHLIPKEIKGVEVNIKGVTAEDRFNQINSWYMKEGFQG